MSTTTLPTAVAGDVTEVVVGGGVCGWVPVNCGLEHDLLWFRCCFCFSFLAPPRDLSTVYIGYRRRHGGRRGPSADL